MKIRKFTLILAGILFTTSFAYAEKSISTLYSFNGYRNGELRPSPSLLIADNEETIYGQTFESIYKLNTLTHTLGFIQKGFFDYGAAILDQEKKSIFNIEHSHHFNDELDQIIKISLDGKNKEILHQFIDAKEGIEPLGGFALSQDGNNLYGITARGGAYYDPIDTSPNYTSGVVYRINMKDASHPTFTILHSFSGKEDGGKPIGSLVLSSDGRYLYGATQAGTNETHNTCGTLFQITLDNSDNPPFKIIKNMDCIQNPRLSFLTGSHDGHYLYAIFTDKEKGGITQFTLNKPDYPSYILHTFTENDEIVNPSALTITRDGKSLYVGTLAGSNKHKFWHSSILKFSTNPNDPAWSILYLFGKEDPLELSSPINLVLNQDETRLYGISDAGGAYNNGGIFVYSLKLS